MATRRIVTGTGPDGQARIVADEQVEAVELSALPGAAFTVVWGSDGPPELRADGALPAFGDYFPPPGGLRFDIITIPPDGPPPSADAPPPDPDAMAAARAEADEELPGLMAVFEPDHPGFHRTDTIDLNYVLVGSPVFEGDGGERVSLSPGDVVVVNGTHHAWRNPSNAPVTLLTVVVGVERA